MNEVCLSFIGFGNVAQGLTQILLDQSEQIEQRYNLRFQIVSIADSLKGSAFNTDGLDPAVLLQTVKQNGTLKDLAGPNWDALEMIQNSPADVVVEMSYTNLHTGEPSTTYITEALRRKKNVITTNKGPIALHYEDLEGLARQHEVKLGLEGTVMSGTPVLRVGRELLSQAGIQKMQGILNGTTNYILTQMETGRTYADALAEAQAQGYAEADPTGDVEGYDAAAKVAILARQVLRKPVSYASVDRQGITHLTPSDIETAQAFGKRWKLVGTVDNTGPEVRLSVRPELLESSHPLAHLNGVSNGLVFSTNLLGDVFIQGPGAGRMQTGYAILQDLFCMYRR